MDFQLNMIYSEFFEVWMWVFLFCLLMLNFLFSDLNGMVIKKVKNLSEL